MQSWKRLLYFILLNVLVSALTTWAVVSFLMRGFTPVQPTLSLDANSATTTQASLPTTAPDSSAEQPGDTSQETDREGNSANVALASDQLEINTIIGAGDLETEHVLIRHVGDTEVAMIGWQLRDEDGNVFTFPALTMFSGAEVKVYSRQGNIEVNALYWGRDEAVWRVGEQAFLVDPDGNVQAVFTVP